VYDGEREGGYVLTHAQHRKLRVLPLRTTAQYASSVDALGSTATLNTEGFGVPESPGELQVVTFADTAAFVKISMDFQGRTLGLHGLPALYKNAGTAHQDWSLVSCLIDGEAYSCQPDAWRLKNWPDWNGSSPWPSRRGNYPRPGVMPIATDLPDGNHTLSLIFTGSTVARTYFVYGLFVDDDPFDVGTQGDVMFVTASVPASATALATFTGGIAQTSSLIRTTSIDPVYVPWRISRIAVYNPTAGALTATLTYGSTDFWSKSIAAGATEILEWPNYWSVYPGNVKITGSATGLKLSVWGGY
jgi:hypothetical protein